MSISKQKPKIDLPKREPSTLHLHTLNIPNYVCPNIHIIQKINKIVLEVSDIVINNYTLVKLGFFYDEI